MSKEEAIREAEEFIRKVLSRSGNDRISQAKIKAAAVKVARVVPKKFSAKKATAA